MSQERTVHGWEEEAAAYALGVLDHAEQAAFERHLAECPECRRAVAELRAVGAELAAAAPPRTPPPALKARILTEARQVRPIGLRSVAPERARSRPAAWAVAAALVLALAAGIFGWVQRERRLGAQREVMAARMQLDSVQSVLQARDSSLAVLAGPDVRFAALAPADEEPSLRVFWSPTRSVFVVAAFALPPAPQGQTYQLWSIAEGEAPVSMGTFDTSEVGVATLLLPAAGDVPSPERALLCALTLEPDGGSPQPTETPRLVGEWRAAE
ncbi:MAG: anti-sigma factor [Gemmatimonadota bacterium]|nr:anti-sigma factor [Gemmatimonadota bacterium]